MIEGPTRSGNIDVAADGRTYITHIDPTGDLARYEIQREILKPSQGGNALIINPKTGTPSELRVRNVGNDRWEIVRGGLGGTGKRPHDVGNDGASAPKHVPGNTPKHNVPDGGFGGKVIDQPDSLTSYSFQQLEDPRVIGGIVRETEQRLDDLYGKDRVEIIGYHISPAGNKVSLRENGFSSNVSEGQGEGVAGKNIYGPGMYLSTRPTNTHMSKDGPYTMYAVVRPKKVPWQEGKKPPMWDSNSGVQLPGDFINGASGELKINPAGIPKVGLMEIGEARLRKTAPDSSPPVGVPTSGQRTPSLYEDASNWVEGIILDPKYSDRVTKIKATTDETIREQLITGLANDLLADNPESGVRLPHVKKWLSEKYT